MSLAGNEKPIQLSVLDLSQGVDTDLPDRDGNTTGRAVAIRLLVLKKASVNHLVIYRHTQRTDQKYKDVAPPSLY